MYRVAMVGGFELLSLKRLRSHWTVGVTGLLLWALIGLIPAISQNARGQTGAIANALVILAPVVLGVALMMRDLQPLSWFFPLLLLCAVALCPARALLIGVSPESLYGASIALIGFFVTLGLSARNNVAPDFALPPNPSGGIADESKAPVDRPLTRESQPDRDSLWTTRFRVYRGMALLSALFPAVLIYAVSFDKRGMQQLALAYPGRALVARALVTTAALLLWFALWRTYFALPLAEHRRGDRTLNAELRALRTASPRFLNRDSVGTLAVGVLFGVAWLLWR